MLPDNFGEKYYLRATPFLQKIGVESITIKASTEGEDSNRKRGRLSGAYVLCGYGYTNNDMEGTKKDFLKYLQEDRKIMLAREELSEIESWSRMIKMAEYQIIRTGERLTVGKDFLLGDDGTGNYSRDVIWQGSIPNINDKKSKEMEELSGKLDKFRRN